MADSAVWCYRCGVALGFLVADKIELTSGTNPGVYRRIAEIAASSGIKRATLCGFLLEYALSRLDDDEVVAGLKVYLKGRKRKRKKKVVGDGRSVGKSSLREGVWCRKS